VRALQPLPQDEKIRVLCSFLNDYMLLTMNEDFVKNHFLQKHKSQIPTQLQKTDHQFTYYLVPKVDERGLFFEARCTIIYPHAS
jgi:hypothetical protein